MKKISMKKIMVRSLVIFVIFLLPLLKNGNKIDAGSETYTETIDGITWNVSYRDSSVWMESTDWVRFVMPAGIYIEPADKEQIVGKVTIPSKVCGFKVTGIGGDTFRDCKELTDIVIPENITVIGPDTFYGCTNLKSVKLPNSLVQIGNWAFSWCTSLETISLPQGMTSLRTGLFCGCSSLKSIVLPNGVTSIGATVFKECSSLESIIIPDNVNSIGEYAFYNCSSEMNIYYYGTSQEYQNISVENRNDDFVQGNTFCMEIGFTSILEDIQYIGIGDIVKPLTISNSTGTDQNGNPVGSISYQWYYNQLNSNTNGIPIMGATSNTYEPIISENGDFYYYCAVTNNCNEQKYSITSNVTKIEARCVPLMISFESNGGSSIEQQSIEYGGNVREPDEPVWDGYIFEGWYLDNELTNVFDFASTIVDDITLYAKWELDYSKLEVSVDYAKANLTNEAFVEKYSHTSIALYREAYYEAFEVLEQRSAANPESISALLIRLKNAESSLIQRATANPILSIEDGVVTVTLNEELLTVQKYVKANAIDMESFLALYEEDIVKGNPESTSVLLEESGTYTFYVTNSNGNEYLVKQYYNKVEEVEEVEATIVIDYSDLNYEIGVAEKLYESFPDSAKGLAVGSAYTAPESKATLQEAIQSAKEIQLNAETQEIVNSAVEVLKAAEVVFQESIEYVVGGFISVNGSTVSVNPHDGCTISRVRYNADENGNLVDGIWKSYTGCNYEQNRVAKYSDFTWENVEDGIYTFEVREDDATGNQSISFELVVVATEQEPVELAKKFLNRLVSLFQSNLDGIKKKSEATIGDVYAPDPRYNNILNNLNNSKNVVEDSSVDFDGVVNQCYSLFDAMVSFNKFVYVMEEGDSAPATITESEGVVTVTKKELRQIYYVRGQFSTLDEIKKAGGVICWPSNNTGTFKVDYNGFYTLNMTYADNTTEIRVIEVNDVPSPFIITEENGNIHIENTGYEIKKMGYAYGENKDINSSDYIVFDSFQQDFSVLGRLITIYFKDCNNEEYYETIVASSFTEPSIVIDENNITLYCYGFDIQVCAFVPGDYDKWDDMYNSAVTISQSQALDKSDFSAGEYTFYFQASDGTEYFKYVTIE